MTKQYDAHVRARSRIITRVVNRRIEWGLHSLRSQRQGESFEDMVKRLRVSVAKSLAAYRWHPGWGMVADEPYSVFGREQRRRMAKDVPAHIIHAIMCTRTKDDP